MRGVTRADLVIGGALFVLAVFGAVLALVGQSSMALVVVIVLLAGVGALFVGVHRSIKRQGELILRRLSSIEGETKASAGNLARVRDRLRRVDQRTADVAGLTADLGLQIEPLSGSVEAIGNRMRDVARDLYDLTLVAEEYSENFTKMLGPSAVQPSAHHPGTEQ